MRKDGNRRKTTDETAAMESIGGGKATRKQRKYFVCNTIHFPYCRSEKGFCNVFKKRHQPYCKRVKTESSHPVANTTEIKQKLKGLSLCKKRELSASIIANFDDLFWITDCNNNNVAEMCVSDEAADTGVVTTVAKVILASDLNGIGCTGNSLIEGKSEHDDDVLDDHVLNNVPAGAGTFVGTFSSSSDIVVDGEGDDNYISELNDVVGDVMTH